MIRCIALDGQCYRTPPCEHACYAAELARDIELEEELSDHERNGDERSGPAD